MKLGLAILAGYGLIGAGIGIVELFRMPKELGVWDAKGNPIGSRPATLADDAHVMALTVLVWPLLLLANPTGKL